MKTHRQLAAIMFTDIVGYTAMMHEDEKDTAAVRQLDRKVFLKERENYDGRVIQYYGDGTLSIFKSTIEAGGYAIAMQQQFLSGKQIAAQNRHPSGFHCFR